jgi:predicted ATPase/DNA-binding CsgD family transcriptional regulator
MALVVSRREVTGSRRLGLLPAEATGFVGRRAELAAITALLTATRMVTVVGPAGVGKTRTSRRAAAAMAGSFPDGTWLADLGGVERPEQLAGAVAEALGLRDSDPAAVLRYLRTKRLLLILDTCEHQVSACAAFADFVLRSAPGVSLLATSRQPLDTPGEHAFPLAPLPIEPDAVDLFAQRAAAVLPGFAVTPQTQADVVRLCTRLDGIPLAIELAAVRMRALPLPELASQLASGIRLLTVSRRGTSPRHQTLRAALLWSYQWCTPTEQALWERLSVFAGTFDVSAAEEVCAGGILPRDQVLYALVGLVDKSVVLRDDADPSRYRLLAAVREFGADQLEAPERYLDRLAARCLEMARWFDSQFRGHHAAVEQAAAVRRLRAEDENFAAVLGYALGPSDQSGEPADDLARWRLGADLAVRLSAYWQVTGQFDTGRQWLGKVADLFPESARERSWALAERGRLATFTGDLTPAVADISESIRLAHAAGRGTGSGLTRGYLYLNLALAFAGQHAEAEAAGETARQQLAAYRQHTGLVTLEAQLAYLQQLTGNAEAAIEHCDRGLALLGATSSADERWVSGFLYLISGLALIQRPGREHAAALSLYRALTTKHELGDVLGTAYAVESLAWLAARREQFERASWLLGAADQLWNRTGRRLSGVALMEESRQRAVKATRKALGERRFTAAYAHGSGLALDVVAIDAVDSADLTAPQRDSDLGDTGAKRPVVSAAALTKREREIAELVASGLSNREIATRLFISKRTVDAHVEHIFGKLEISSRLQLTVLLQDQAANLRVRNA